MNCCKNKKNGNKSHMSHMLMMILCCGAPILLLAIVPLVGIRFKGISTLLTAAAPFMCPLMMLAMIPMMLRGHKKSEND